MVNEMRIKEGFILKKIADDFLVVPTGDNIVDFAAAVSLNETGAFLWEQIKSSKTLEELTALMISEYDVDETTAEADTKEYISLLKSHGFIED